MPPEFELFEFKKSPNKSRKICNLHKTSVLQGKCNTLKAERITNNMDSKRPESLVLNEILSHKIQSNVHFFL